MAVPIQADYADIFFGNFATLRLYAEQVFVDECPLTEDQDEDQRATMEEFLTIGERCDFTKRQLIALLFA